jgi:ABC-type proline/glycine betaine transport system substrate-binding protein
MAPSLVRVAWAMKKPDLGDALPHDSSARCRASDAINGHMPHQLAQMPAAATAWISSAGQIVPRWVSMA